MTAETTVATLIARGARLLAAAGDGQTVTTSQQPG